MSGTQIQNTIKDIPEIQVSFYRYINNVNFSVLKGELYTLVDAIFVNPAQNKAIKDSMRARFSDYRDGLEKQYEKNLTRLYQIIDPVASLPNEIKNVLTLSPVDFQPE